MLRILYTYFSNAFEKQVTALTIQTKESHILDHVLFKFGAYLIDQNALNA